MEELSKTSEGDSDEDELEDWGDCSESQTGLARGTT